MKCYILLLTLTLCTQIESYPKKHSALDCIHAALVGKADRNCRSARLEAKEKYLKRKKDRDAKHAWLDQEELLAFKEKNTKTSRAYLKKYQENLSLLENLYEPAKLTNDGRLIIRTNLKDPETGDFVTFIQSRRNSSP